MPIKSMFWRLADLIRFFYRLDEHFDEVKFNQGRLLVQQSQSREKKSVSLCDVEFKVYSQWGEDGIIQFLLQHVPIDNKTFIEFGVGDFRESNCRFLMEFQDWQGFVVESDVRSVARLKRSRFCWQHDLVVQDVFLTRDNVNDVLISSGFSSDLGLLSIDVDGNDYHFLEALTAFQPRILICEFNPVFEPARKWVVPYEASFRRERAHYSRLYWGASLGAMVDLAGRLGYRWAGVGSKGANAFFVRQDLWPTDIEIVTPNLDSVRPRFRESRGRLGGMTLLRGGDRLAALSGMPVVDLESGSIIRL